MCDNAGRNQRTTFWRRSRGNRAASVPTVGSVWHVAAVRSSDSALTARRHERTTWNMSTSPPSRLRMG